MNNTQIENCKKFYALAQSKLAGDTSGHSLDHILRVVNNAVLIARSEAPCDLYLIVAAALLHDVIDDKLTADPQKEHQFLEERLAEIDPSIQASVFAIIDHLSFSKNLSEKQVLSQEGQIVQDADRLDAIGAIGIARTFYYGGHVGNPMYDPELPPRTQMDAAAYRSERSTVINHFYEKLLLLESKMNTETGRRLARKRTAFMEQYLQEFFDEWNGQA